MSLNQSIEYTIKNEKWEVTVCWGQGVTENPVINGP